MKTSFYLALAVALSTLARAVQPVSSPPEKPNVVVILMDDMGYADIGPFGSKLNRTPHLERMAREGLKLTSFYAAPVCSASRAQLMTGCYSKRVSIGGALPPVATRGLNPAEHTVAELLKAQGYTTMIIGKWHLGDQPEFLPTRHGFDHYFGLPYSNDMDGNGKPGKMRPAGEREMRPPLPLLRDDKVLEAPVDQDTLTQRYTQEALKFIAENQNRPFFLYFAHTAVHVPLHPGPEFKGKSANGAYGDWVEEADWSVGQVLDTLKRLKLDRKTLVLFTSDNGPWLSKKGACGTAGPFRGGKFSCWEGGMREPAIAWWPGQIKAGMVNDAVASEMDVLPTAVGLAGGQVPADHPIDGKDLWPLLSGKTSVSPHEALFYWEGMSLAAVRSGPWKLVIKAQKSKENDPDATEPLAPQLFNLEKDPGETIDVAGANPEVAQKLQALVEAMDKDLGLRGDKAPGVRVAGFVADPKPLMLRGSAEYD